MGGKRGEVYTALDELPREAISWGRKHKAIHKFIGKHREVGEWVAKSGGLRGRGKTLMREFAKGRGGGSSVWKGEERLGEKGAYEKGGGVHRGT